MRNLSLLIYFLTYGLLAFGQSTTVMEKELPFGGKTPWSFEGGVQTQTMETQTIPYFSPAVFYQKDEHVRVGVKGLIYLGKEFKDQGHQFQFVGRYYFSKKRINFLLEGAQSFFINNEKYFAATGVSGGIELFVQKNMAITLVGGADLALEKNTATELDGPTPLILHPKLALTSNFYY